MSWFTSLIDKGGSWLGASTSGEKGGMSRGSFLGGIGQLGLGILGGVTGYKDMKSQRDTRNVNNQIAQETHSLNKAAFNEDRAYQNYGRTKEYAKETGVPLYGVFDPAKGLFPSLSADSYGNPLPSTDADVEVPENYFKNKDGSLTRQPITYSPGGGYGYHPAQAQANNARLPYNAPSNAVIPTSHLGQSGYNSASEFKTGMMV